MAVDRAAALRQAVDAEEAWQRADLEDRRRAPWPEPIGAGVAWPELEVTGVEPAARGRWRWTMRAAAELPDAPGPGDAVDVCPAGAGHAGWRGRVAAVDGRHADVEVSGDEEAPARVRVLLRHDPSTFSRQREALARVAGMEGLLAAVLRGDASFEGADPDMGAQVDGLDPSQAAALGRAVAAPALGVLYGPPGTGKTRTLVALLRELVRQGERPWALADSNAAVDHLAVQAHRAGLVVVRLGAVLRVGAEAAPLTLDAALRRHTVVPAVAAIDRDLRRLRGSAGPAARAQRRTLFAERDRLVDLARAEILSDAQVLATTLGSMGREAPGLPRARTAVIDEATQATEPASWVAAGFVQRLVLAGDPHQLGPVVKQPDNPLARSLLQRVLDEAPQVVSAGMLEVQRRMNADLHALLQGVYGARYRPHASVAGQRLAAPPAELASAATWIDTAGAGLDEQRDPATSSWFNPGEVAVVATAVELLRRAGLDPGQIGVITPYAAQASRLRAAPALAGVEVSTVNGFQGREREAILLSMVRSNLDGEVGFATDRRRFTVSLSRARRALVVVGDTATVGRAPWVHEAVSRIAEAGGLRSVWEPPWSAALEP